MTINAELESIICNIMFFFFIKILKRNEKTNGLYTYARSRLYHTLRCLLFSPIVLILFLWPFWTSWTSEAWMKKMCVCVRVTISVGTVFLYLNNSRSTQTSQGWFLVSHLGMFLFFYFWNSYYFSDFWLVIILSKKW